MGATGAIRIFRGFPSDILYLSIYLVPSAEKKLNLAAYAQIEGDLLSNTVRGHIFTMSDFNVE